MSRGSEVQLKTKETIPRKLKTKEILSRKNEARGHEVLTTSYLYYVLYF
jgi:hypothetical protein